MYGINRDLQNLQCEFESHLCLMLNKTNKSVYKNLLTIHGVGKNKATEICETVGVSTNTNLENLSTNKKDALTYLITNLKKTKPGIENELKLQTIANIQRLIKINCYRWKTT